MHLRFLLESGEFFCFIYAIFLYFKFILLIMEPIDLSLDHLIREYEVNTYRFGLEKKKLFIDLTHDGTGRMCRVYYYPESRSYSFEPIRN